MGMLRNDYEKKLMVKSGQISSSALKKAIEAVRVGVTGLELDKIVEKEIYRLEGDLSYKTVPGYKWASCITINEQVVHGIPTGRKIVEGDVVSVDLAVSFKGWHTDTAWSVLVGKDDKKSRFLNVGEEALRLGIAQAVAGNRVGDIGAAIQGTIEEAGYSVVRSLVGHGVGRVLHEDPEIPGYGRKGTGTLLKQGMTLAIEVIYTEGLSEVKLESDGWTISSADASLGGLFEKTVVVGKERCEVLTDWQKLTV